MATREAAVEAIKTGKPDQKRMATPRRRVGRARWEQGRNKAARKDDAPNFSS
jgi:hypothetical protein